MNLLRIGAGFDDKIVFERAVVTIEHKIDTFVDPVDTYSAVVRDTRQRVFYIFAAKIVADAAGRIETGHLIPWPSASEFHPQGAVPRLTPGSRLDHDHRDAF